MDMEYLIFYSWQSDSPRECNWQFIREALDEAVRELTQRAEVQESPRVESGMEGISGTPEVATVMLARIRNSAIFVGDMTLVGTIDKVGATETKRVPNPNVLLEMGYAAALMGWHRVICVMNEHFGLRASLPFDVRNRRYPINYSLVPGSSKEEKAKVRKDLSRWIGKAIQTVLDNEYEAVNQASRRLDVNCLNLMLTYRDHNCFCEPDSASRAFGGMLDTDRFSSAVSRLLDLGLIDVVFHLNWRTV
jgi:hypothetical protein